MIPDESGKTTLDNDSADQFRQGQIVGAKYKVNRVLGRGGMGIVYEVEQIFIGKHYALKTLNKCNASELSMRRLQVEAKAASLLDHPNLVQVHDFGLLDEGQPFLIMDCVDGITLADRLSRCGPFKLEEAARAFAQVCLGLNYAHDQNIVHRDIKPSNIMLVNGTNIGDEGSVKVLDFGIAKLMIEDAQVLTRTGDVFGSPFYMSPEQCSGAKVDHRSDIYSLGCVLYEALTGAPPHMGVNPLATMMLHQTQPALPLKEASLGREFSPAIEHIVAKMLQKAPDDRYQNLGLVAHDLSAVFHGQLSPPARSLERKTVKLVSVKVSDLCALVVGTAILSALPAVWIGYQFGCSKMATKPPAVAQAAAVQAPPVSPLPPMIEYENTKAAAAIDKAMLDRSWTKQFFDLFYRARDLLWGKNRSIVNMQKADLLLAQCQQILKQLPADQTPPSYEILILTQRGACAYVLGHFEQAEGYASSANRLADQSKLERMEYGAEALSEAAVLDEMFGQYYSQRASLDDMHKSETYYQKALALHERRRHGSPEAIKSLISIGGLEFIKLGNRDEGIKNLEQARDLCVKTADTPPTLYAEVLTRLANAYQADGKQASATKTEQQGSVLLKALLGSGTIKKSQIEDWAHWADKPEARASREGDRQNIRQLVPAMGKLKEALARWDRTGIDLDTKCEALISYGDNARGVPNWLEARHAYNIAQELLEKAKELSSDRMADVLLRQGILDLNEHKIQKAQDEVEKSVSIKSSLFGSGSPQTAEPLSWLAAIYANNKSKSHDAVLKCYELTEAAARRGGAKTGRVLANAQYYHATYLISIGQTKLAIAKLMEARKNAKKWCKKPDMLPDSIRAQLKLLSTLSKKE